MIRLLFHASPIQETRPERKSKAERITFVSKTTRGWTPSVEDFTHAAAAFVALERRVVACQLAGLFREGPPTGLAQLVWSTVHGQVSLELRGMLFVPDPDASFEELLELIAAGISA